MKKKKEAKTDRKIHRDFTLDEFDDFTLELQNVGAKHEQKAIVRELIKAELNLKKYSDGIGYESKRIVDGLTNGVRLAIALIESMPDIEDRCECENCGGCNE